MLLAEQTVCVQAPTQSNVPSLLSVLCADEGVAQHRLTLLLAGLMWLQWSQVLSIAVLQYCRGLDKQPEQLHR